VDHAHRPGLTASAARPSRAHPNRLTITATDPRSPSGPKRSDTAGCDLAVDAAQHRYDVDIVIRDGIYFQPKDLLRQAASAGRVPRRVLPRRPDLIARLLAKVSIGEWKGYPGMPQPKHSTLAESQKVVNNLLLYWIQHGRVRVVPGISRIDGKTVTFTDGTRANTTRSCGPRDSTRACRSWTRSSSSAATVSRSATPAASYRSVGEAQHIGLSAPRGPQIPVYGVQTKLAIRMIAVHEAAGEGGANVQAYLSGLQEADDRIDIVRNIWIDQLSDTERLLDAFEHARPAKGGRRAIGAATTAHAPAVSRYRPTNVADESHRPRHSRSRGSGADPGSVGTRRRIERWPPVGFGVRLIRCSWVSSGFCLLRRRPSRPPGAGSLAQSCPLARSPARLSSASPAGRGG